MDSVDLAEIFAKCWHNPFARLSASKDLTHFFTWFYRFRLVRSDVNFSKCLMFSRFNAYGPMCVYAMCYPRCFRNEQTSFVCLVPSLSVGNPSIFFIFSLSFSSRFLATWCRGASLLYLFSISHHSHFVLFGYFVFINK